MIPVFKKNDARVYLLQCLAFLPPSYCGQPHPNFPVNKNTFQENESGREKNEDHCPFERPSGAKKNFCFSCSFCPLQIFSQVALHSPSITCALDCSMCLGSIFRKWFFFRTLKSQDEINATSGSCNLQGTGEFPEGRTSFSELILLLKKIVLASRVPPIYCVSLKSTKDKNKQMTS